MPPRQLYLSKNDKHVYVLSKTIISLQGWDWKSNKRVEFTQQ